jgi:hypothetical protein
MRVRNLLALSGVLLLSVGAATSAAAHKQSFAASQQLCLSNGAPNVVAFSTKTNSSFYGASYKGERVLWTCNNFSNSAAAPALVQSCLGDGGLSARSDAPGFVTCWKD